MKPAVWLVVVKSFVTSWMSRHCVLGVDLVGKHFLTQGHVCFFFFINNEKIDLITAFCVYLCYLCLIFKFV